jgi:putative FmdB family regulatory protein
MPIYEFVCTACGRRSSVFQRRITAELNAVCPHCHGADLRRLVSQFAVLRSSADAFDDSALAGLDENDPAAMERWARTMGEEMGGELGSDLDGGFGGGAFDDLGGDDFDE